MENLVGYSKTDLMIPLGVLAGGVDPAVANPAATEWCTEVNNTMHSEIAAVPATRLAQVEAPLLGLLPSLRPSIGRREIRKVDRLSCVRFASARYSVPSRLVGDQVTLLVGGGVLTVMIGATGEVVAEHAMVPPGEVSIVDAHYPTIGPVTPARKVRPKTVAEKQFCALSPVAEAFLKGAAAAGNTRLGPELSELAALEAAHGREALIAALRRAVAFGRWYAGDVRSILAAGHGVTHPQLAGEALIIELPLTVTRSLADYSLHALSGEQS